MLLGKNQNPNLFTQLGFHFLKEDPMRKLGVLPIEKYYLS